MKLKHIIYTVCLAATMTACSNDFLENKPQGSLNDAVMGSTDGAELLVNAAYAALGGPEGQDWSVWCHPTSNWTYGEVRSDNAYKGGGGTGDLNEVHRMEIFDVEANNGFLDSKWYHLYCSLQRCNAALNVLNAYSDDEINNRQSRIGEMRVLRAHFFFELVRLFNKVPYFDENVATPDYTSIRNDEFTRDQLLGKIAQEMLDAAELLPESQSEVGRIHKYIALAYAAKVKLYQAYEEDENTHKVINVNKSLLNEVVQLIDRVLNTGRYGLLDDYQGLDLIANENGKESVFAIQYSMNDGSASAGRINWSNLLNSPSGNSPYSGDGFFLPSQDIINAYQTDANGLPEFDYQSLPDYSVVNFVDEQNVTISNTSHSVDPRLDFVVGRPTITWKTYTDSPCMSWVRDRGTYGHNCIKRFWVSPESGDMYQGWPWGASSLNWQIIRTADLYLWKAEALIEIGTDLETARTLINTIRTRAMNSPHVKDFNDSSKDAANYNIGLYPASGWTQDYARKALRTETRLEKAFEGERYFDLVRWGIAGDVMTKYIDNEKDNRTYYNNAAFTAQKDEYYPIPTNQYNFSGGIYTQNPGYPSF
jgi:hypothetical protein